MKSIVLSILLAASMPLAAEQARPGGADPLRSQILTFEDVLRRAIEVAGEDLSKQVQQQLNTPIPIQFGFDPTAPIVRGWPIDAYGYHFDVQIPDVAETGILVWQMWGGSRPNAGILETPPAGERPARPVASGGAVVADDPTTGPAASGRAAAAPDPTPIVATYRANVRHALIDAILNNPGVLNLRDGDMLAVSAAGMGQSAAYRLSTRSARLTLYIRGADLAALREGKLTRDQARQRITEKSF